MGGYVIVTESSADISREDRERHGIRMVPMRVAVGGVPYEDGATSPEALLEAARRAGEPPRTSGCTPGDLIRAFEDVHAERPDARILYLGISSSISSSLASARIAAQGRPYVTLLDTRGISGAQGVVTLELARLLEERPDAALDEVKTCVRGCAGRLRVALVPGDLAFLRAGGRLSNASYLGAQILRVKPMIELVDGRLVATRVCRGGMAHVACSVVDALAGRRGASHARMWFERTPGLPDAVRAAVEDRARELGFARTQWVEAGCVIAAHCGPGMFGAGVLVEPAAARIVDKAVVPPAGRPAAVRSAPA